MRWLKHGIVWRPDGRQAWARSHGMLPTPVVLDGERVRVYVTCCDADGIGRPGFVDLDARDPRRVLRVSDRPLLDVGAPGTFDENGVLPCSVVRRDDGLVIMYYAGFELGTRIRYRILTGIALSEDGGETFRRLRRTPVLERSDTELYFRCGPCARWEDGRMRLWYIAGSDWTEVGGKPMPVYVLHHLESADGLDWGPSGRLCMDVGSDDEHGFGRPWVERTGAVGWRMFYSVRRRSLGAYRIGYAESPDGLAWQRRDDEAGLDVSASGFDDQAIMYAATFESGGRRWCLYNGNGFGADGFALAEAVA